MRNCCQTETITVSRVQCSAVFSFVSVHVKNKEKFFCFNFLYVIELLVPLFGEEDENEVENEQLEQDMNGIQIELINIVMEN